MCSCSRNHVALTDKQACHRQTLIGSQMKTCRAICLQKYFCHPSFCHLFFIAATLSTPQPVHVDLPTVMKLAGANNDEIQLARVKHTETLAESKLAWQRFWPS
jgi:hypothetical protein